MMKRVRNFEQDQYGLISKQGKYSKYLGVTVDANGKTIISFHPCQGQRITLYPTHAGITETDLASIATQIYKNFLTKNKMLLSNTAISNNTGTYVVDPYKHSIERVNTKPSPQVKEPGRSFSKFENVSMIKFIRANQEGRFSTEFLQTLKNVINQELILRKG